MFNPASNTDGSLIEPGNYVLTVKEIEDAGEGQFGPSMKWIFTVADPRSPSVPMMDDDGEEVTTWQWTSCKMTPRARARKWVEALLGHALDEGERISERDLIGRQMEAFIIHVKGDDGNARARISTEVELKPVGSPAGKSTAPAPAAAPANGSGDLVADWRKTLSKAELLEVPGVAEFSAIDPDLLSPPELNDRLRQLKAALVA